jgi:drug/metabolite transporter (DMT)-like permease
MLWATGSSVAVGSSVEASSVLTTYPVLLGQALRYLAGALLLSALVGPRLPRPALHHIPRLVLLAMTGMVGFNVCMIIALQHADASTVGTIVGAVPVVLALTGPLQRRHAPRLRLLLAAVIVCIGAGVVQWAGGYASALDLLLATAAMLCEAAFSLLALSLLDDLGATGVSTYASFVAATLLIVATMIWYGPVNSLVPVAPMELMAPTAHQAVALMYLAVTAGSFLMWYSSLKILPVDTAGLFAGLVPVSALLTSTIAGATTITPLRMIGVLTVGFGVIVGVAQPGIIHRLRSQVVSRSTDQLVPGRE